MKKKITALLAIGAIGSLALTGCASGGAGGTGGTGGDATKMALLAQWYVGPTVGYVPSAATGASAAWASCYAVIEGASPDREPLVVNRAAAVMAGAR